MSDDMRVHRERVRLDQERSGSGLSVGDRVRIVNVFSLSERPGVGRVGKIVGEGVAVAWRVAVDGDEWSWWPYSGGQLVREDLWGPPTGPMVYTLEQHDHQVEKATFRALFEAACNAVSALGNAAQNEARWLVSGDALEKIIDTDRALAYAFQDVFGEFPSGGDS